MLKKYTPPYFSILTTVILVNMIFSSYFIAFFLAGVVFQVFKMAIAKGHNYIVLFSILTFLIIENTQGLQLFSLTIIALIVYLVVIPRMKHLFSSNTMSDFLYIFAFYLLFYLLIQIYTSFETSLMSTFLINFFIDILVVGFVL